MLLCLIIGLLYLVAFWLVGVPYALLLAVLGGLFEFIPYVGADFGGDSGGYSCLYSISRDRCGDDCSAHRDSAARKTTSLFQKSCSVVLG
jgi:hypothetical protein